jgi:hypothetical protein
MSRTHLHHLPSSGILQRHLTRPSLPLLRHRTALHTAPPNYSPSPSPSVSLIHHHLTITLSNSLCTSLRLTLPALTQSYVHGQLVLALFNVLFTSLPPRLSLPPCTHFCMAVQSSASAVCSTGSSEWEGSLLSLPCAVRRMKSRSRPLLPR